jgi:hypothetical protein
MLTITSNFISSLTLNIDINQKVDFIPKSESIKKYINSEIEKVIKESLDEDKDIDVISFKPSINYVFVPYFNGVASYSGVGFTPNNLLENNVFKDESFYLFDLYDSYIDANQNLISRNFLKMSKIIFTSNLKTDINFDLKTIQKEYTNIYVPSYFINTNIDTFYFKIWFFNATNGKLRYFECSKNEGDNLKNYFKIKINKNDKTYEILNGDIISNTNNTQNYYKISQIVDTVRESQLNENISNIIPRIKDKKIITTNGKFI